MAQCGLAVAGEGATFALSGIGAGLFRPTPSVPLLRGMGAKQAVETPLHGDFIDARQARRRGLVNRVAFGARLDAEVERLVRRIPDKSRAVSALGKTFFYQQREMSGEAACQLAGQTIAFNMRHARAREGVRPFVEKRALLWRTQAAGGEPRAVSLEMLA